MKKQIEEQRALEEKLDAGETTLEEHRRLLEESEKRIRKDYGIPDPEADDAELVLESPVAAMSGGFRSGRWYQPAAKRLGAFLEATSLPEVTITSADSGLAL